MGELQYLGLEAPGVGVPKMGSCSQEQILELKQLGSCGSTESVNSLLRCPGSVSVHTWEGRQALYLCRNGGIAQISQVS